MPTDGQKYAKNSRPGLARGMGMVLPFLALAGMGIWYRANQEHSSAPNQASPVKSTVHLETFVLNLADPEQRSYLRVGIDLGINQEIKHGEELAPVGEVRDTILGVLAEAKVNDLLTAEGKTKLKENLLHALQERVPRLGVEEVYFTEFLIQR